MAFTASTWGQGRLLTGLSPGSSLSGFTAVITKANLPTSALDTGSLSCLNGGGDWRFSTDINGSTQLPAQIVTCVTNATAGNTKFEAFIRFPTYASGTREVYAFWNKAGQSQPLVGAAFGRNAVWVDYNRVYHLNEAVSTATGNYVDSSGNGDGTLNATTNVTSVTGQIGDATQSLNSAGGSSPLIDTGIVPNTTNIRTLEFWVNYSTTSNSSGYAQGSDDANNRRFYLGLDGDVRIFAGVGTGFMGFGTNPNPSGIVAGSWYKQSLSVDGSTATVYVNGVAKGSFAYTFSGTSTSNFTILGRNRATVETRIEGIADLYTIGKNEKSVDLLLSEFNNQNNPSTFWTAGAVFVPGGGGVTANGAVTLPSLVFSGSATDSTSQVTANGDVTLPSLVFSGSATDSTSQVTANGDVTLPSLVFSGSATDSTSQVTANGDVTLPSLVFSGSAAPTQPAAQITASGDITLPSLVFSGSAAATQPAAAITASGDITLPSLVFSGSATDSTSQVTASGDITLPSLVFSGTAGEAPEVTPDFSIIIDASTKTIQTTANTFTIRI
jgi:hypothetical protein